MQASETDHEEQVEDDNECICYWAHLWTKPRAVFAEVGEKYTWQTFWFLGLMNVVVLCIAMAAEVYFYGTIDGEMADTNSMNAMMMQMGMAFAMIIVAILMFVMTIISWLINGLFVKWTGTWLGGIATFRNICVFLSICSVPYLELLLLESLLTCIVGLAGNGNPDFFLHPSNTLGLLLTAVLHIFVGVYTMVIASKGLAVIQEYASAWRGFGNLLLGGLIMAVVFIGLAIVAAIVIPIMLA